MSGEASEAMAVCLERQVRPWLLVDLEVDMCRHEWILLVGNCSL